MSQLANQYANAVMLADQLGMPRPQRPTRKRRRQAMPPVPEAARGAAKRARRRSSSQGKIDLANRLWSKLIPGTAAAGEGIVPYAAIPETIRGQANLSQPVTGWDPRSLEPDERALLTRILSQNPRPEQPAPTQEEIERHERRIVSQQRFGRNG